MMFHRFALPCLALSVVFSSACGSLGGNNDGGLDGFCSTDSQCATGEICHPTGKFCVKTCMAATDCPSSAKTCDLPVGGTGSTTKVCQCSTTQLCNGGSTGNLVCSDHDKICMTKCSTGADCPSGRTCDATTGQCKVMMSAACTQGSCTGGNICDFTSGQCKAPAVCSAVGAQPDVCGYGAFCSTLSCAEIAPAMCVNFAAGSAAATWNPATATGPVIYAINKVAFVVDSTFCCGMGMTCANDKRAKIHVAAYHPGGMLLGQMMQPSLQYYRTDTTPIAINGTQIQSYMTSNSGKNANFDVNFCLPTATTSLSIGLVYDNGNGACFTVN